MNLEDSFLLFYSTGNPLETSEFSPLYLLTRYQSAISNEGNLTRDSVELGPSHIGWLVVFLMAHTSSHILTTEP